MPHRQNHSADDRRYSLSELTEQIVTKKGDRDQGDQPERAEDQHDPVFVVAATQEQSEEADRQDERDEESVKLFVRKGGCRNDWNGDEQQRRYQAMDHAQRRCRDC
jgi:hypothetical protein